MRGRGGAAGGLQRLAAARRDGPLFVAPETRAGRARALVALVLLAVLCLLLTVQVGPAACPPLTLALPVVLGALLLERPALRVLLAVTAVAIVVEVADRGWHMVRPGSVVVLVLIAGIAVELARDRERLGLSTGRSEIMLLELRDQLTQQGELPALPGSWAADVVQRSAGGSSFGGDFLVSTLTDGGRSLELAIVDVSGKGVDAGTRALLLSGALGALLGSVPADQFLPAANDYLIRQNWNEGFATALHVAIDLRTGDYRMTNAGHPPGVHYSGGSGRWQTVDLEGMLLGVSRAATFGAAEGRLLPSDALLLYTDGLIEVPGRDLSLGIDRLLGAAEARIPRGFAGGAESIVDAVAPNAADDRAVVLLWRS